MRDYTHDLALVRLSSNQLFLVSNSTYATVSSAVFFRKKGEVSSTAGFWKNLGYAPSVRGTVMNPNDHPHGGRTKAIRYQRTP
jgi:large subunit ribosomal protein L2